MLICVWRFWGQVGTANPDGPWPRKAGSGTGGAEQALIHESPARVLILSGAAKSWLRYSGDFTRPSSEAVGDSKAPTIPIWRSNARAFSTRSLFSLPGGRTRALARQSSAYFKSRSSRGRVCLNRLRFSMARSRRTRRTGGSYAAGKAQILGGGRIIKRANVATVPVSDIGHNSMVPGVFGTLFFEDRQYIICKAGGVIWIRHAAHIATNG